MTVGPRFWRAEEPETLTAYPDGWAERVQADVRGRDQWLLGGILFDRFRERRIRANQDWRTLMSPTLARYPMPERAL